MQINPPKARLSVPGTGTFSLTIADDEELVSWDWRLFDAHSNPVEFHERGKAPPGFLGFTWVGTISAGTREIICPIDPTHGFISIKATAQIKDKAGTLGPKTAVAEATFTAAWGGVMAAKYPHPVDWDKPWTVDPHGQRALVLMFDLINQMPEELRSAAGSIPITRVADLGFAGGFHAPYVSDAIIITDGYVSLVSPGSATLTEGDRKFISVVLHEIAHAITYQRCSVNVHGVLAQAHHAMRNPNPNNIDGWKISVGLAGLLAMAHMLLFGDFVSGYAHVARWELTAWYFRLARYLMILGVLTGHPAGVVAGGAGAYYVAVDFIYWLSHLGETANWPAVNPNVITGYWGLGKPWGLKNLSFDTDAVAALQEAEFVALEGFQKAEVELAQAVATGVAADIAAAKAKRDAALNAWQDKHADLVQALRDAGIVSKYAATDVLEDIAETVMVLAFGPAPLNAMRNASPTVMNPRSVEVFVTDDGKGGMHDGFARRRRYLVEDAGLFPKNFKPIEPGRFMRGQESFDQLHQWQVEY